MAGDETMPKPAGARNHSRGHQRQKQKKVNPKAVSRWVDVEGGRLTASGCPSKKKLPDLLASRGVTHVVTLLAEPRYKMVQDGCAAVEVAWTHVPLSGGRLAKPEDRENVTELWRAVAALRRGESVLVHCAAGMHRTGISCYVTLRLAGWSAADAAEGVRAMREVTHEELLKERRAGKPSCRDTAERFASEMLDAL